MQHERVIIPVLKPTCLPRERGILQISFVRGDGSTAPESNPRYRKAAPNLTQLR